MSISIFLPVRKGNERIPSKNTRKFSDFRGGLLEYKLLQLSKMHLVDEIVVSTNDERCMDIASRFNKDINHLQIVQRPEELGMSDTSLTDLIVYAGKVCKADDILWTHVTNPFCNENNYQNIIAEFDRVKKIGYDSLITGRNYKEFLIDQTKGEIVNNFTPIPWPRTQDLAQWFEINNAVFLASRSFYRDGNRIGKNPFYLEMDKISSMDIDWKEDFKIAEAVYEKFYK